MAEKINIAELNIDVDALIKSASEVKSTLDSLRKAQKQLSDEGDTSSEAFIQTASAVKSVNQAYNQQINAITKYTKSVVDQTNRQDLLNVVLGQEVQSIEEAREQNKLLNQLRNQTNVTTAEGAEELKALNEQLDRNNDFVQQNADGYLRLKMNVGNYKDEVKDSFNQMNIFNGGLSGFIDRANEAGGVAPLLKNGFSGITSGIMGMAKAGLAFIMTPIGATLAVIAASVAAINVLFKAGVKEMNKTTEGSNKLNTALAKINALLQPLMKLLGQLGKQYIEYVINQFDRLYDGVMIVTNSVGNFINMIKSGSGDALKGWVSDVQNVSKEQKKILDLQDEYNKKSREARLIQLNYQKDAERLRQIRDDESLSTDRRIQANRELGSLLNKQGNEEIAIQMINLRAIEAEIKLKGNLTELEDRRIEALTSIADIQERITGQQSEQKTNINSLRKEAQDQAKQRADEAKQRAKEVLEESASRLEAELQLYLAKNQLANKSELEIFEIEKEASKRRIELLNAEFKAGEQKQSDKIKLEASILEEQNSLALKEIELAQQVADRELEIFINANSKKLTENKFITDELYNQEVQRLNDLESAEYANLSTRLANKLISQAEYDVALDKQNADYQAQRDAVALQKEEEQKAKAAIDLENKLATAQGNFMLEYQLQTEQLEQKRLLEVAEAEKTGADITSINDKYAKEQMRIDGIMNENKVALASQAFGNLAKLFGENSRMGKAMAVMQTTVDTYQSAMSAYKGMIMAVPGPVGIALGAVAAAASVATGIANVKKITSTKEPKYARGGIFEIGGQRHSNGGTTFTGSDGSSFEAERGEGIGILSRGAYGAFQSFNNTYRDGLGSSLAQMSVSNNSIVDAIRSMPAPVVIVEDINKGQTDYIKVINYADLK